MSVAIWVGYPRSYTSGRNRPPQFVTLHYTAGSEGPTSAESGANYDQHRTDGTSTHYFTDSEGPALQEVPEGDRSHAALFHGNEIGIHIEICGTVQSRDQWLDPVSYKTLEMTAALTREICLRNGYELRRLTVDETRTAYYGKDHRPTGINDHNTITLAFPEDGGTHTDVGTEFPWDVFMAMVLEDSMTTPAAVWAEQMPNPNGGMAAASTFQVYADYYAWLAGIWAWQSKYLLLGLAAMQDPIEVPAAPERFGNYPETQPLTVPNLLAQAILAGGGGGPGQLIQHTHELGDSGPAEPL